MHTTPYSMSAYAVVRHGSPLGFHVRDGDEVEIQIGGNDQPLTLLFDHETFRELLEQGAVTAQQMAHRRTSARSEDNSW